MANDLKVYNHLNYKDQTSEEDDGFVRFLFRNSEIDIPEIDEQRVWEDLNQKIHPLKRSFSWIKIAVAVAILVMVSATVYFYDPAPFMVHVASLDKKINVTFPDGSIGVLNKNSTLSYPEKFENERNVSFTGEAYFDIQKNEKPFIIDVNDVDIKVLGTAFNLITTENEVKLFVDRGLVAFEKEGKHTKVLAGNEAIFNRGDASIEIKSTPSSNIMSWRNGVFTFNDIPLKKVLQELNEYYEVEFELSNKRLNECKISATFNKRSLKEVLETIGAVLRVETIIKQDKVKISGQGC